MLGETFSIKAPLSPAPRFVHVQTKDRWLLYPHVSISGLERTSSRRLVSSEALTTSESPTGLSTSQNTSLQFWIDTQFILERSCVFRW